MTKTTRRQFLQTGGAAAVAFAATRKLTAHSANSPAAVSVVPPLSQFNYSQVELLDGPFREQFDHNHNLYLHLDEDALLKPFPAARGDAGAGAGHGRMVRQCR